MTLALCPTCGAPAIDGEACRDRFDRLLALELTDPAYGVVHHLTVPAYYLQHPGLLSARGWPTMRDLLGRFLNDGATPADVRARFRREMAAGSRDWSVTLGPSLELPPGFAWRVTILTIDPADPDAYPAAITAWTRLVLADAIAVPARLSSDSAHQPGTG